MSMEKGLYLALTEGAVSVPSLLLQWYAKLGLSETDLMLLIHLIAFKEKEQKDFPTIEEIQSRMSAKPERVILSIQKLMSEGWLAIDEDIDPDTDIQYERYNISGLYEKLAEQFAQSVRSGYQALPVLAPNYRPRDASAASPATAPAAVGEGMNLFVLFEKEFGRPLSPMECETITGWLDKDHYSDELIVAALKESVFAGKVHFKYIDRILLEWARNRVKTPEDAKQFAGRYRGNQA